MKDGYLPGFGGNPILASCENCTHCVDVSDGVEYGPAFFVCEKKPSISNLKSFPFQLAQKCCELHFSHMTDWGAEARKSGFIK